MCGPLSRLPAGKQIINVSMLAKGSGAHTSCVGHRTREHCALSVMLTVSQLSKSFAGRALFDTCRSRSPLKATGLYRFYLQLITDFWGRILVRSHGVSLSSVRLPSMSLALPAGIAHHAVDPAAFICCEKAHFDYIKHLPRAEAGIRRSAHSSSLSRIALCRRSGRRLLLALRKRVGSATFSDAMHRASPDAQRAARRYLGCCRIER